MVNFRVVEGDKTFENVKDDFTQLYKKGVKIKDIQKKLNLTQSQYTKYFQKLRRNGDITELRNSAAGQKKDRRNHYNKYPRYYSFNHYTCLWVVKYHSQYFASFRKKEQAQCFVDLMKECNWDKSRKDELKWKAIKRS